jgi:hypothetical protein
MNQPRTDYEREIVDFVDKVGCFVVTVLPEEGSTDLPFCYSIGFTKSLDQPEVIFIGLPADTGHALVNTLFEKCAEGLKLTDGTRVEGIANFPIIAKEVDESWITQSYFASALWYHRTQLNAPLRRVMQMVWPDPDGHYPWEESCADWAKADQLQLYEQRIPA